MTERPEVENRIIQLRKGILELAIMGVLYGDSHYGYSLVRHLAGDSSLNLKEGTVYPILGRLSREGLVESHWRESHQGPPRKYYDLTVEGRQQYEVLYEEFELLAGMVRKGRAGCSQAREGAPSTLYVMKEKES